MVLFGVPSYERVRQIVGQPKSLRRRDQWEDKSEYRPVLHRPARSSAWLGRNPQVQPKGSRDNREKPAIAWTSPAFRHRFFWLRPFARRDLASDPASPP